MKKNLVCSLAAAFLAVAVVVPAFSPRSAAAQVGKGLSGPHYTLNIIGVPKGKNPDMTILTGIRFLYLFQVR